MLTNEIGIVSQRVSDINITQNISNNITNNNMTVDNNNEYNAD